MHAHAINKLTTFTLRLSRPLNNMYAGYSACKRLKSGSAAMRPRFGHRLQIKAPVLIHDEADVHGD